MTGHVAGAPVEELLPLLSGVASAAVLGRAWVVSRLRRTLKRREADSIDA